MRLPTLLTLLLSLSALMPAQAQPLPDDASPAVQYGVGLRLRGLFVPRRAFERFVEVAPSGIAQPAIGLEGVRRRGRFELVLGLSVGGLSPADGIWLDEPQHNPSLVEFDGFSWLSLDLTAVWARPVAPRWALRYGMGIGVGVVLGTVRETDYTCPPGRFDRASCRQSPTARDIRHRLDMPPVLPVVNGLVGVRYAPTSQIAFNLDAGLHTALFLGFSVDLFFR